MLPTTITGTGRARVRGTDPLAVVCRPSHFLNQPRPQVSGHHRSHMGVVEGIMVSGHHRSHMAVVKETMDPITQGVVEVTPAETRPSNNAMYVTP